MLEEIANGLKFLASEKDDLYKLMVDIAREFDDGFRTAFKMRRSDFME